MAVALSLADAICALLRTGIPQESLAAYCEVSSSGPLPRTTQPVLATSALPFC
jgi:hypothetical protein